MSEKHYDQRGCAMSWNYRVVRESVPVLGTSESEDVFTIREIYYDDDGRPELWSSDACHPQGETFNELCDDLGFMFRALGEPVLEMADLPGYESRV